MPRPFRSLFALLVTVACAGPAAALGLDFELEVASRQLVGPDDVIVFEVSLTSATDGVAAYDFTFAWDDAELDFVSATDQLGGLASTGTVQSIGTKFSSFALTVDPILGVELLFELEFHVTSPVDDAAFDDVLVLVTDAGCGTLPGCDGLALNGAGLGAHPSMGVSYEVANPLGFAVEIGASSESIVARVPEPAALALLACALAPFSRRRG